MTTYYRDPWAEVIASSPVEPSAVEDTVACPACDGDARIPVAVDHYGAPLDVPCTHCGGVGELPIQPRPEAGAA